MGDKDEMIVLVKITDLDEQADLDFEEEYDEDELVEREFKCPDCGERRIDALEWQDDDSVRCDSCGRVYRIEVGGWWTRALRWLRSRRWRASFLRRLVDPRRRGR